MNEVQAKAAADRENPDEYGVFGVSGRQDLNLRPPGPQKLPGRSAGCRSQQACGNSTSWCGCVALRLDPELDPVEGALPVRYSAAVASGEREAPRPLSRKSATLGA